MKPESGRTRLPTKFRRKVFTADPEPCDQYQIMNGNRNTAQYQSQNGGKKQGCKNEDGERVD